MLTCAKEEGEHLKKRVLFVDGVDVRIVKWYDNRVVQLASSCCSVQPLSSVEPVVVYNPYHLGTGQKSNAFPLTVQQSLIYV